ncbi:unnamed protein product [Protopolystoma xenopodis]|uniref:Uncharacterized protein n=1 Tax=Protopolystoma xenopodis TaxID=117903 RepID=A0A3S5BAS4_9PLAT|nr:unnamed protein product [Protopolystoma xenopodis]
MATAVMTMADEQLNYADGSRCPSMSMLVPTDGEPSLRPNRPARNAAQISYNSSSGPMANSSSNRFPVDNVFGSKITLMSIGVWSSVGTDKLSEISKCVSLAGPTCRIMMAMFKSGITILDICKSKLTEGVDREGQLFNCLILTDYYPRLHSTHYRFLPQSIHAALLFHPNHGATPNYSGN